MFKGLTISNKYENSLFSIDDPVGIKHLSRLKLQLRNWLYKERMPS